MSRPGEAPRWLETLQSRWQGWWLELESREQRLVIAGALLVGLALVYWIALAPALRTLKSAPAEQAELDAQLQQMSLLQQQAKALQAQPRASRDDALRALETSVRQNLGPNAQMQSVNAGEGVTVALRAVPADALAQWLTSARGNARAVPREAHLTHGANAGNNGGNNAGNAAPAGPAPGASPEANRPRWDGTLVMGLPAR
jgi:general secretion pathway protein M